MKTFSTAMDTALLASVNNPVWLLKLDLKSGGAGATLYLSDQKISLWGQNWSPVVMEWGGVDRFFDPAESEIKVSDMTVKLDNRANALGAGMSNISWYFRKYDLADSVATLYLWLNGAGLTEPSGVSLNDLMKVLEGTPELSSDITPSACSLDIVNREAEYDNERCSWGDLLLGQYTLNQWGSAPTGIIGKWKPAVFGNDALTEGVALIGPIRIGKVEGPDALFDASYGADNVVISYPAGGEYNVSTPVAAPCDIYVGDWRLAVKKQPEQNINGHWVYTINAPALYVPFYIPAPLKGATPIFVPSAAMTWPRSDESKKGPYAQSEPPRGAPYQFYHGVADTGNWRDGYHPGRSGPSIKNVYVDGVEVADVDMRKDDGFGIVWLRSDRDAVAGTAGNPETARIKWTGVDTNFTTGDTWLRADQLTAKYPHGYNANSNPCILGDFAIPASGGGAPAASKLGLKKSPWYPPLGARMASARFVLKYTGVDISSGTFHLKIFDREYTFNSSELSDGSAIAASGWNVSIDQKGAQFEIWPNNNGHPYTATSPDPRYWDIYELSKDVTTDAMSHVASFTGFSDSFSAWFTGTVWPSANSIIVLGVELEILFEPVQSAIKGPAVTALIGGTASKAGEIMASLIPAGELGAGFTDSTLPDLKYRIDSQESVCRFIKTVARESNTELVKNYSSGKYDLVKKSDSQDNVNLPAPTGGAANIGQDDLLADEDGLPMIRRSRSAPESVINEVTVSYIDEEGKKKSLTLNSQGSVDVYGARRYSADMGAGVTEQAAEDRALDILNANAEVNDYYSLTFALGAKLAIEPNDILNVTADMDGLSSTMMRVVSVEIEPGSMGEGSLASITVNALRYSTVRRGFGQTLLGSGPFGAGRITEN